MFAWDRYSPSIRSRLRYSLSGSGMLPSNVPEWPSEPGPGRRLVRAALKPLLALVLIGGLVGLGLRFVGLDQLAKLAQPQPASSGLPGGANPESRNWAGYAATAG